MDPNWTHTLTHAHKQFGLDTRTNANPVLETGTNAVSAPPGPETGMNFQCCLLHVKEFAFQIC